MPNNKKLNVKFDKKKPAIEITRNSLKADHLVYIAKADRHLKYNLGKSRIAYIGTTSVGVERIAMSAAKKAQQLLHLPGFKKLSFFIVTCSSRQRVQTWKKLESGLIHAFKHMYGEIPKCNTQGKNKKLTDEHDYFTRSRLETVIKDYSD